MTWLYNADKKPWAVPLFSQEPWILVKALNFSGLLHLMTAGVSVGITISPASTSTAAYLIHSGNWTDHGEVYRSCSQQKWRWVCRVSAPCPVIAIISLHRVHDESTSANYSNSKHLLGILLSAVLRKSTPARRILKLSSHSGHRARDKGQPPAATRTRRDSSPRWQDSTSKRTALYKPRCLKQLLQP